MSLSVEVNGRGSRLLLLLDLVVLLGSGLRNSILLLLFFRSFTLLGICLLLSRLGSNGLLDDDLLFLGPAFDNIGTLEARDLMNVVADLENKSSLRATLVFCVLQLTFLDLVVSNLVREAGQNWGALGVVHQQLHVAELVVKSDSLGGGER